MANHALHGAADASAPQGFGSEAYVRSLDEFGTPVRLPRSGAWILVRPIAGTSSADALGGYPFLACGNWPGLEADLDEIGRDLVSISVVTDPFGGWDVDMLRRCFPDRMVHFKDHLVADLATPWEGFVSRHHRDRARRAARQLDVEVCEQPLRHLDTWLALFAVAVERFKLSGLRAFSPRAFERQFAAPGTTMALVRRAGEPVAAGTWLADGNVAYTHVAALTDAGREMGASYLLYQAGLEHYAGRLRWIDWGADAGVAPGGGSLSSFKRGWSTGTRPAYFCGRIFDPARYRQLTEARGLPPTEYFPAYRQGEFG